MVKEKSHEMDKYKKSTSSAAKVRPGGYAEKHGVMKSQGPSLLKFQKQHNNFVGP